MLQTPLVQAGIISLAIFLAIVLLNEQAHNQKIREAASLGEIVDTAGRQRMLSQRIAKNLLLIANGVNQNNAYTTLEADLATLNREHQFLTETVSQYENSQSRNGTSPRKLLNQISSLISTITQNVNEVLSGQRAAASILPTVLASEQRLVPLLDQYNATLTTEKNLLQSSQHKIQLTRELLFLFALIAVLFCAIWYMLSQIQKYQSKLRREKQRLLKLTRVMKDRQQKLSAAISASFHETWSWTESIGEFWCSDSFWRVFGYQETSEYPDATYQTFLKHIDPDNRGLLETAIQQHLENGAPIHLELSAKIHGGTFRWVRIQAKMITNEADGVEYLAGTVEDIHEHKLAKLQLDHKETLLTKVGKVAKIGGWHVDLKTNELFWTSETYKIHEVEPDFRPTVETGIAFYAPEARPVIQQAVEHAIETGEPWDLELPFITAKGRHIWVRTQGELEFENNKPVRLVGAFQDISAEKQREIEFLMMQDEKFSSHARLESVISAATEVSIIATNPEGIITLFSPGAERLLGYTAEEMIGIKTPECFHLPEEVEQRGQELTEILGRTVKNFEAFVTPAMLGSYDQREWTYVCKDGIHRTVELTVTAIRNQQDEIEGYLGVAIDITLKKQNEKQLLESRETIRHLMDALPVATYTCDNDGLITYYNQAAIEFWERTPYLNNPNDRYCGSFKLLDAEGKSTMPYHESWTAIALQKQEVLHDKELIIECENGTTKTALAHISPMHDLEGKMTGVVNVLVDISERKALEKSLKEATTRLELCLKVLDQHAIVAETELNGYIRHVNDMFCQLTGYERHEAIGKTHRIVSSGMHSQDFWKNVFKTIADTGMWQGEICNRKKNGELYWVDTTIAAMKDGDGISTGYLAIRNDITELKQAQEAALAASQSKSQFLANMSHEIRTPLTAILGYADLLKVDPEFTTSPEKREQAVNTILEAGNHLLTVINDILDLSKIEAGKMGLEKAPTQVFNTLEHIESLLRPRAIEKGVQLGSIIETPIPDVIESDPTRLRQILMNLVGNAVKFTEQGKINIIVRQIEEENQKLIQFDIEDTGPGMSPRQAEKIFKSFSQADTSVTRQHGGTGLGLVISRKLARLMGGEVSLAWTERGKGTCFRFEMPERPLPQTRYLINPSLDDSQNSETTETKAAFQVPENTRILLAEDGLDNQRLISFLLKKLGALVDVSDNGSEAYRNYLEAEMVDQPYHLLITDMQMPEMDGYSLTKVLRAEGATLPIIALTAHAMAEDRQKCLDAGCDDYLSKPVDRRLLAQTVEKWMAHVEVKTEDPPVSF
ncbi:PAS domain S-box protein [Gimesia alba]|uniref:PAS domain S-box protein n=1 Tax=Gimesia alba TaxID=2527973 RepID=UPI0018D7DD01|nr:PAS domain S-box protein [Gimesia alba]